jgi:hypothetical protein
MVGLDLTSPSHGTIPTPHLQTIDAAGSEQTVSLDAPREDVNNLADALAWVLRYDVFR